jgi:hypothetical protein
MFFFNKNFIPFFIVGWAWILFSRLIINSALKRRTCPWHTVGKITIVWTMRIIGIGLIAIFYFISINHPNREMMKNDENRIILLEQGKTVEGKVLKQWYDNWESSSWMILYSFEAPDSAGKLKTYYGSAKGPKSYYADLSKGDIVTIIYYFSKPEINCEMYEFLSNPIIA